MPRKLFLRGDDGFDVIKKYALRKYSGIGLFLVVFCSPFRKETIFAFESGVGAPVRTCYIRTCSLQKVARDENVPEILPVVLKIGVDIQLFFAEHHELLGADTLTIRIGRGVPFRSVSG